MAEYRPHKVARRRVPDFDHAAIAAIVSFIARGDEVPVGAEGEVIARTFERVQSLPGLRICDGEMRLVRARENESPVGAEGEEGRADFVFVIAARILFRRGARSGF